MDYEQLKSLFPFGLVIGHRQIAKLEPEGNATGPIVDFDAAYEVIGYEGMLEIVDKISCLLSPENENILRSIANPNPKSL